MQNYAIGNFLSRILAYGAALTTVFIVSGSVTDPVNTPKMFALALTGMAGISVVATSRLRNLYLENKLPLILLGFFLLFMLSSTLLSKAPLTQILYGAYGRNNGFLTYVFLTLIYLSALTLKNHSNFQTIINALLLAGAVNLIYCLWVIIFGDFIGWDNPYGNILGTLGNPNFIGAFLGIIFSTCLAIILDRTSKKWLRLLSISALPVLAFEIMESHAVQGRVVAAFGSALVVFVFLKANYNKAVLLGFSATTLLVGGFALAGALQKGPLTDYIYKTSVSLRGQYWLAGWNTGQAHPFSGVGMDTFGDWYRRMRDAHALELPGVNTIVNTAHNVPLDIFAFGGWPLFLTYLAIMGMAGVAVIRVVVRQNSYDVKFVVMASAWAGYQLQSVISINQIGLAIWGWLLSGAVIAYERVSREPSSSIESEELNQYKKNSKGKSGLAPQIPLYVTLGSVIGVLLALPPLAADIKWRSAQISRTLPALEAAMIPTYFNPPNSTKFLLTIQTLEQSDLGDLARKYALEAVKWNPDVFDSWKVLYLIQKSTPEEKMLAIQNMKRLDPLNPDVTATN